MRSKNVYKFINVIPVTKYLVTKYVTLKARDYYNYNGIDDFLNEMIESNILYNCSSDIATQCTGVYC